VSGQRVAVLAAGHSVAVIDQAGPLVTGAAPLAAAEPLGVRALGSDVAGGLACPAENSHREPLARALR
jgi:hypothetical protein